MSQNDLSIANQGFASFRSDLNSALQALGSTNSGTSAPSTTYANQLFYDTTNNILKIRNEDNDAFINLITLDQTNDKAKFDLDGTELILDADGDSSITSDTDDQIDFRAGGTDVMAMSTTGLTITNASNDTQLTLKSTDADANVGPVLDLNRDSGSPADSDFLGKVQFSGDDDGGNKLNYAFIDSKILDASNGSEDGQLDFYTAVAGSSVSRMQLGSETVFNQDSVDVDFRVESDVNANTLFVEGSTGNVGIGTNSLNVSANDTTAFTTLSIIETIGNRSGILEIGDNQDQEGGGIGSINFVGHYQDVNHKIMAQISSFSEGSTSGQRGSRITMRTKANGSTSSSERMRIDSSGNVLIGTTSSTIGDEGVRIKPSGSAGALQAQFMNDSGGIAVTIGRGGSDGMCLQFTRGSQERGGVSVNGSSTTYATSSDYRLKENVVTDWDATTRLKQLKPSRFNFKENKDTTLDGFLAHEVTSIVPEATTGTKDEVDKDGNPIYQGIDPSKLVPLLTKAIQEAVAKIETLESKVKALESK